MRRTLLCITVLAIAALALPVAAAPAPALKSAPEATRRTYPLGKDRAFSWASYHPAPNSGLMPLSGAADYGLVDDEPILGEREQDEASRAEAVPAGIIPKLPANFSPNVLVSQDLSSTPHNETSVAVNPKNPANIVVGANDYRLGYGSSGFYATLDGGRTWRDGILPHPTAYFEPLRATKDTPANQQTNSRTLISWDGGGDPALAFDRGNTVYYADINFHRIGCQSGVFVYRSINGGLTWNRPLFGAPSGGDPRVDGDGIVVINSNDNDCGHFYDKEWIATGPRPKGAELVAGSDKKHLSPDRLYVTWTDFQQQPFPSIQPYFGPAVSIQALIMMAYSDDQGRHFSMPAAISGANATLCPGSAMNGACVTNQGSVPVVDKRNGKVFVYFFNGDTASNPALQTAGGGINDQLLSVTSADGGKTFSPPVRIAALVDNNLPVAGSTRCPGNAGRQMLGPDTCFRWTPFGNVTIDPRTGRLYATWSDNRNGDPEATDVDVFVSTSSNGASWSAPKRVNTDKNKYRTDQFFPWADVDAQGILHVSFLDRAKDKKNHNIGASLCISKNLAKSFTCSSTATGLWDPDHAFRDGLFIGDYTGIATGPFGSFSAFPDARRASGARPADNPPALFSEVVGAFAVNFVPAKARGRWVDVRLIRKPIVTASVGVRPGKDDARGLWAAIALIAALIGIAALPAARKRSG